MKPQQVRSAGLKPTNAARMDCYNQSTYPDLIRDPGDANKQTKLVIILKGTEERIISVIGNF